MEPTLTSSSSLLCVPQFMCLCGMCPNDLLILLLSNLRRFTPFSLRMLEVTIKRKLLQLLRRLTPKGRELFPVASFLKYVFVMDQLLIVPSGSDYDWGHHGPGRS